MALRIVFPWDAIDIFGNSNEELGFASSSTFTNALDLFPGKTIVIPNQSQPNHFVALGNKLIFEATDGTHGRELWITDGTSSGTRLLKDINPGSASAFPTTDVDLSSPQAAALFQPVAYKGFV